MRIKLMAGAAAVAVAAGVATGGAALAGSGEGDHTVTGPGADQATAAALDATGGGQANSVERDSENGATWEVEVTKDDGTIVDVRLDGSYALVVIEGDSEDASGQ